jgi:hypothetical protein
VDDVLVSGREKDIIRECHARHGGREALGSSVPMAQDPKKNT